MRPTIIYEEILETSKKKNIGFVDVRSPKEYQQSTIPGAVNIPVLDDSTREKVGFLYVNGQINEAKQIGIEWASRNLPEMYARYQKLLSEYDELVLFCSRGGMRSSAIFSLLKALGMPVSRLQGGYKAYRHHIMTKLTEQLEKVEFVTLYGLSGSGKTEILENLSKRGMKTLDLEACANHRGSLLGSVGLTEAHSQKMFESLLFDASREWQTGERVFTEGESKRIGKVVMPPSLFAAIQKGKALFIDASIEYRIAQIYRDYVEDTKVEELTNALEKLKKVMNEEKVNELQKQLLAGNGNSVIEKLLVSYYDPRYSYNQKEYLKVFNNQHADQTAEDIITWQNESEWQ